MSRNKNSNEPHLSLEKSLHMEHAMKRGLSRRDAMKLFGMSSLALAGLGASGFGSPDVWAAGSATASQPKRGGSIRVAAQQSSTKDTLDPALGSTAIDYVRCYCFYNVLAQYDEKLVPQPCLAESFQSEEQGKRWIFNLRKGVKFHDGKPLTPQDVIYSIMRHKDPKTGSQAITLVEAVENIKASSDSQVEITLRAPNIEFVSVLADPHFCIIPDGTTDFSKGIGTGPFKCQEFKPGVRSVAVRNPEYWREGRPYLDSIEVVGIADESARVNALLAGDVQLINNLGGVSADRIKGVNGKMIKAVNSGNYSDLIMRFDREPTSRPEFREAMKYLFNREQMLKISLRGYGEIANDQPIAPSHPYFFKDLPQREFDPDKATALLKKAGVAGARLPLVVSPAANYSIEMGQFLQQSASQAGLNLQISMAPADGYWSNHWMKDTLGFGNVNPRPTANILMSQFFYSKAPWNEAGWKNDKFDQLLIASRSETDEAKRTQMYADMQTIIHEQSGIAIPLFLNDLDGYDARLGGYDRTVPMGGFMAYMFPEFVWWNG